MKMLICAKLMQLLYHITLFYVGVNSIILDTFRDYSIYLSLKNPVLSCNGFLTKRNLLLQIDLTRKSFLKNILPILQNVVSCSRMITSASSTSPCAPKAWSNGGPPLSRTWPWTSTDTHRISAFPVTSVPGFRTSKCRSITLSRKCWRTQFGPPLRLIRAHEAKVFPPFMWPLLPTKEISSLSKNFVKLSPCEQSE